MEGVGFDYLDSRIERVTAWDVPLPYAQNLERNALPQVKDIVEAVKSTLTGYKSFNKL